MKRTILNQTQLQILEQAVLVYGSVVTFADLAALLADKSDAYKRTLIKSLVDTGWLVRIQRGVYQIAEMSSLGSLSISRFAVAQILVPESYVSFEAALQYWGLYDQLPATVTSVALRQYGPVEVARMRYRFVKTVSTYFYGWQTVELSQRQVRIACAEKALIDMVQFHRTSLSLSLVVEKLAENRRQLDFDRLKTLLLQANLTTVRIWGNLLDAAGVDTASLQERSASSTSASHATPHSNTFVANWRLYVDPVMAGWTAQIKPEGGLSDGD